MEGMTMVIALHSPTLQQQQSLHTKHRTILFTISS